MVQNRKVSILHDMAKIAIKYDNIVPYGGIFYAMNEFKRTGLDKLVDCRLNVRCANYGYTTLLFRRNGSVSQGNGR